MTAKEKALSQLLQLSETEAEVLSAELSSQYAVLPDRETLEAYESWPEGYWVGLGLLVMAVIACTALVCAAFCGGV